MLRCMVMTPAGSGHSTSPGGEGKKVYAELMALPSGADPHGRALDKQLIATNSSAPPKVASRPPSPPCVLSILSAESRKNLRREHGERARAHVSRFFCVRAARASRHRFAIIRRRVPLARRPLSAVEHRENCSPSKKRGPVEIAQLTKRPTKEGAS